MSKEWIFSWNLNEDATFNSCLVRSRQEDEDKRFWSKEREKNSLILQLSCLLHQKKHWRKILVIVWCVWVWKITEEKRKWRERRELPQISLLQGCLQLCGKENKCHIIFKKIFGWKSLLIILHVFSLEPKFPPFSCQTEIKREKKKLRNIQEVRKRGKKNKNKKKERPSAVGIRMWSPTILLTDPTGA